MKNSNGNKDFWVGETVSLLTLSLLNGVGYWTIRNIALASLGFKQVLKANSTAELVNYLAQAGLKNTSLIENQIGGEWPNVREELWSQAVKLYKQLEHEGIQVIHFEQDNFPQSLREIADPPKWLFVQGNISILHQPSVAIVGTRNPSEDGKFLAHYVGKCLPYFKAVTVSGLASGIDQIIHQESIRFQVNTIAVLGTGIMLNYPAGSEKLRQEIHKNGGAIISEYLPYQSYTAENFVRRNRLQAGLACAVIPVEWKVKSGTAHTVRFAKESRKKIICLSLPDWSDSHTELLSAKIMGADVFTIPGQENLFLSSINQSINVESSIFLEENSARKLNKIAANNKVDIINDFLQLSLLDDIE